MMKQNQQNKDSMRRKALHIIGMLALVLLSGATFAQKAELDSITRADTLYAQGHYPEAARVYSGILKRGYESADLYFNLGNAYYKSGQVTKAILNYERARLLAPNDDDIKYNLDLAQAHVVDNIQPLPEFFLTKWWHSVINTHSADEWGVQSMVAFFIFLILFVLFLFAQSVRRKKLAFWVSILSLTWSAFTFSFASSQKSKLTHRNTAIITAPTVTVKGSPSETGTELFIIHEGLKVKLTDSLGTWKEIQLADGNKGWVQDSTMVRI